jgi:hypothetical protein
VRPTQNGTSAPFDVTDQGLLFSINSFQFRRSAVQISPYSRSICIDIRIRMCIRIRIRMCMCIRIRI